MDRQRTLLMAFFAVSCFVFGTFESIERRAAGGDRAPLILSPPDPTQRPS